MHELIISGISCGFFAWLFDSRLFKGKRKYMEMCNWYDKTVKAIESATNYQDLVDIGKEIPEKFKHYQKYVDYDVIRDHNKAIVKTLENKKDSIIFKN